MIPGALLMIVFAAAFVAAGLSFSESKSSPMLLRVVVAAISAVAFCAIIAALFMSVHIGTPYGGFFLIFLLCGLPYFAFMFLSCFSFISLPIQRRCALILHFILAPLGVLSLVPAIYPHAGYMGFSVAAFFASFILAFGLLWFRMYELRVREST